MKKLFSTLLLFYFCTLVHPAFAAWEHDGIGSSGPGATLSSGAGITPLTAPWTISGWLKVITNTGTGQEWVLGGNAAVTVNPSFHIYCNNASEATNPGKLAWTINDASADLAVQNSTNTICNNLGVWQLVTIVNDATNYRMYVGTTQETTVAVGSVTGTATVPSQFLFARTAATVLLNAAMCDWAKWNRALSSTEIASRAAKFSSRLFPTPAWCMDMIRDYIEPCGGLTVTNTSTTVSDCPPLYYPN